MSQAGLRIRVDDSLRHRFIEACKGDDTTASQVLRAYMRSYVKKHIVRAYIAAQPQAVSQRSLRRASSYIHT
jgi:hypothetical protein